MARLTILWAYPQVGSALAGLSLVLIAVLTTQGQAMREDEPSRSEGTSDGTPHGFLALPLPPPEGLLGAYELRLLIPSPMDPR